MLVDEFKLGINKATTHSINLTSLDYTVNVSGFSALNPDTTSNRDGALSGLDNGSQMDEGSGQPAR